MLNAERMPGAEEKKIGDALQRLRNRAGMTQTDLANKAGLSLSIIQKVEASKNELKGTRPTHRKIAEALGFLKLEDFDEAIQDESNYVNLRVTQGTFAGLTARAELEGITLGEWLDRQSSLIVEIYETDPQTGAPSVSSSEVYRGRKRKPNG